MHFSKSKIEHHKQRMNWNKNSTKTREKWKQIKYNGKGNENNKGMTERAQNDCNKMTCKNGTTDNR